MDRNTVQWRGYWPASPTPFKENGDFDFDVFAQLIEWYLARGMHGLFINGTTGEWFSQSHDERKQLAEFVLRQVGGRVPVVIGVTTFTAKESAVLGAHAMEHGAAGICSSAPAYAKTLPDETVEYFRTLTEAVKAPTMIYNWPHGTGIEIEGELAQRIADLDYVVAIKDSTGNTEQFQATTKRLVGQVRVFGNFMTTPGLAFLREFGGDGTIGGGSIFGAADPQFWEDVWSGDFESAAKNATRTDELLSGLWAPGGWRGLYGAYQSQLKAIMALMGVPGGTVRPPRLPLTDAQSLATIAQVLRNSGVNLLS